MGKDKHVKDKIVSKWLLIYNVNTNRTARQIRKRKKKKAAIF